MRICVCVDRCAQDKLCRALLALDGRESGNARSTSTAATRSKVYVKSSEIVRRARAGERTFHIQYYTLHYFVANKLHRCIHIPNVRVVSR